MKKIYHHYPMILAKQTESFTKMLMIIIPHKNTILIHNFMMKAINFILIQSTEKALLTRVIILNHRINHVFLNKEANSKTLSKTLVQEIKIRNYIIKPLLTKIIFTIRRVKAFQMM